MKKSKTELLREFMPETAGAFEDMMAITFSDGALPIKVKELIAIGVAVSMSCEDCMDHHIAAAKGTGATTAEISEAMSVGFQMGIERLYPPMVRSIAQNLDK